MAIPPAPERIRIHNSLTGRKEPLVPLVPGRIGMYVCGDTVYDLCHMGHARSKIVFDVVRRYLAWSGFTVTYVRNITDVDDKIIRRAAERGEDIAAFTEHYIGEMHRDYDALGILRPDHEPRATQYVPGMIEMTRTLVEKGYAYVASNGDVLYSVARFPGYGKLSGERLSELRAGERVEIDAAKRDPLDFVLWKRSKPGEPSWPSPWGPGRPGWHLECSVMAQALLGARFDIHGGGLDLKFPHHENEIAQSCAASGEEFARVWMHNGFLTLGDEKMSKSLGNIFTIRSALARVRHPEVIRYFVLSSHYRGPISYSAEQLEQAEAALTRIYTALHGVEEAAEPAPDEGVHSGAEPAPGQGVLAGAEPAPGQDAQPGAELAPGQDAQPGAETGQGVYRRRFREAMNDDFGTPEALAVLQDLTRELNTAKQAGRTAEAARLAAELRSLGEVLGLCGVSAQEWRRLARPSAVAETEIDALVARREAARQRKDFAEADRIRAELSRSGVLLEDRPGGRTEWRRA